MREKTLISVIFFTLIFTLIFLPKPTCAWLSDWSYKRNITIYSSSQRLFEPIEIFVDASFWTDKPYNDSIRITTADDVEIPSFVYNITQNNGIMSSFTVAFEGNLSAGNTTFFMYYDTTSKGNPSYSDPYLQYDSVNYRLQNRYIRISLCGSNNYGGTCPDTTSYGGKIWLNFTEPSGATQYFPTDYNYMYGIFSNSQVALVLSNTSLFSCNAVFCRVNAYWRATTGTSWMQSYLNISVELWSHGKSIIHGKIYGVWENTNPNYMLFPYTGVDSSGGTWISGAFENATGIFTNYDITSKKKWIWDNVNFPSPRQSIDICFVQPDWNTLYYTIGRFWNGHDDGYHLNSTAPSNVYNKAKFYYFFSIGDTYSDCQDFFNKVTTPLEINVGSEERKGFVINIYSPLNQTYFVSKDFELKFESQNFAHTVFEIKVWLDNVLEYENTGYYNATNITLFKSFLPDGSHNFTVWVSDGESSAEKSVFFTIDMLDFSVNFSGYVEFESVNYTRNLVFNISLRNGNINNATINIYDNETLVNVITIPPLVLHQNLIYIYTPPDDRFSNITIKMEGDENTTNHVFINNFFMFLRTVNVETDQNITFGFFTIQPNMTFKFKVYSPYAPYINCSIQSIGNITYYPQNYSIFYNYSLPAQNPIRIGYSCRDLVNNTNESVVEWDIYIVKLIPVDEEIGIYNTSLWFDPSTNKTAIIRFVAVSDIFNQSLLWENISQNVWLVIPTSSWIFRLETLYANNYLSSNYYLKDYLLQTKANELKICVPENKPQNLQTVFSSVPIERSFMIKRAEIGCVKEISQATHSIGTYWGFYFYSLPALYTLSEVINGTEIFITAIRGEAENLIDLQKILYQFNLIPTKLVGINILNVKKGDSSTIITFYSNYNDDYVLRVYKDNEEIYTHSANTANFSVIMVWNSFGINESDVLIYKVFNSKGQEVASLKSTAGGREIKYSALFTGSILVFVLLISFLKPINIEKIFILGLLALFVVFYFVPYTESNVYITILSFSTIILLLTEGVIIWKMVR